MTAKILIIDDDDTWRGILVKVLEEAGYDVHEAENGDVGLQACRDQEFQLVITDIFMPERDGLEIVRTLRTVPHRPKIIAMSGSHAGGQLDFAGVAARLGADKALQKPFGAETLRNVVLELVGGG